MTKTAEKIETLDLDSRIAAALAAPKNSEVLIGLMNENLKETERQDQIGRAARAVIDTDATARGRAEDAEHAAHKLRDDWSALMTKLHGSPAKDTNPAVGAWRPWKSAEPVLTYEELQAKHQRDKIAEDQWRAKICNDMAMAKQKNDREMEQRMLADAQRRRDRENGFD
jgi:hypothetical protein